MKPITILFGYFFNSFYFYDIYAGNKHLSQVSYFSKYYTFMITEQGIIEGSLPANELDFRRSYAPSNNRWQINIPRI